MSLNVEEDTDGSTFLEVLSKKRATWKHFHPYIVCLLDTPLHLEDVSNLFSVDDIGQGLAIFTTHNVGEVLMPIKKLDCYIAFKLTFNALKFSGGNLPFHTEDRGCIFDYRELKTSIASTIASSKICDQCRRSIQAVEHGISSKQLAAIYKLLSISSQMMKNTAATKFVKPLIFIGSSVEGLSVARALQSELEHDFHVEIWNQSDVFGLGTSTLEALEAAVLRYSFSILIFTPDDKTETRGSENATARDNVIFEAGLFIGKIGRFRTFIVKPRSRNFHIPSDSNGITVAEYEHDRDNLKAAIGPASSKLRVAFASELSKPRSLSPKQ